MDKPIEMIKEFCGEKVLYGIVADVGCGPRCGIFKEPTFEVRFKSFAVDPRWGEYARSGKAEKVDGVERIRASAEKFSLPVQADFICSFDSLDDPVTLRASVDNVMANLHKDGTLFLRCSLENITSKLIDSIMCQYAVRKKQLSKEDKTYALVIQHP